MITFCGFSYRSSGIIRGMQLSQRLQNSEFLDIDRLSFKRPKNEVVLHVRKFDAAHAQYCKSLGLKVGFDVADNPVTDFLYGRVKQDDFSRYVNPSIDFYIVNNDLVKEKMEACTDKKVYVVPHHNCNFDKVRNPQRKPKTIGYIGLPEQSIDVEKLQSTCSKLNLSFFNRDIIEHSKLSEAFSQIDIGMVFFEKEESKKELQEKILNYKPGTKLSNFQSYGIPTVCLPYQSFKQFGEGKCRYIETIESLEYELENLVKNEDAYHTLSTESAMVGEKFHIDHVLQYYKKISEDMTNE